MTNLSLCWDVHLSIFWVEGNAQWLSLGWLMSCRHAVMSHFRRLLRPMKNTGYWNYSMTFVEKSVRLQLAMAQKPQNLRYILCLAGSYWWCKDHAKRSSVSWKSCHWRTGNSLQHCNMQFAQHGRPKASACESKTLRPVFIVKQEPMSRSPPNSELPSDAVGPGQLPGRLRASWRSNFYSQWWADCACLWHRNITINQLLNVVESRFVHWVLSLLSPHH